MDIVSQTKLLSIWHAPFESFKRLPWREWCDMRPLNGARHNAIMSTSCRVPKW
jgi:hypothetical protein